MLICLAIQAECYGGRLRVYSTKEFPGLQASTELTKVLSAFSITSGLLLKSALALSILRDGVFVSTFEKRNGNAERKASIEVQALYHLRL